MTRIVAALLLALGLLACAGLGQESLLISEQDEIAMGAQFHQELLKEMPAWTGDPRVSEYVAAIGQRLVPHTHRPTLAHTFTVVETDQINAFAVPGGFIYVTSGLLAAATSGAEVATVLAHELGHVSARHGVQAIERMVLSEGLADLLGGSDLGPIVGSALQVGAGLVFDQDQEYEADELGVRYALAARINAWGIVDFFTFLQTLEGEVPADAAGEVFASLGELFSTHPPTAERIAEVQADLDAAGVSRTSAGYDWDFDPEYATIRALVMAP